ncbi:MAG: NAD(P)-binding domain-containing protein [Bryobacteraceae bacterium]|nr:NAD(P)-binding domain-containing protein [Bryobacteraceae bacterium]
MRIGVVGSGKMGGGIGTAFARAGHEVFFSFSRDSQRLQTLGQQASARFGSPAEAVAFGEVLLLSVWFPQIQEALEQAGNLNDRILLTCVSGLTPDFTGETMGLPSSMMLSVAEQISELAPGARVVESFNLTFAETIAAPNRDFKGDRPSLPYCGDDADAKHIVAQLITDCGYEPVDAGPLKSARSLESLASIWVQTAAVTGLFPDTALKILRR